MPKQSRIKPTLIDKDEWIDEQDIPSGVFIGEEYGVDCVIVKSCISEIDKGPSTHVHPYDEIVHIIKGSAKFTIGTKTFIAKQGSIVIGPANIPHSFKNEGPEALEIIDIHLSKEWIQYDLPEEDKN